MAIKVIETETYKRLKRENGISEGAATKSCCNKSPYVVQLVEEFRLGYQTYIVTKFVKGGDILSYLKSKGVNRLPEAEARQLFK